MLDIRWAFSRNHFYTAFNILSSLSFYALTGLLIVVYSPESLAHNHFLQGELIKHLPFLIVLFAVTATLTPIYYHDHSGPKNIPEQKHRFLMISNLTAAVLLPGLAIIMLFNDLSNFFLFLE